MDQELKTRWVEALRSGNYAQVQYVLNDGRGGFCCIGVLADITGVEWIPTWDPEEPPMLRWGSKDYHSMPPMALQNKWGIGSDVEPIESLTPAAHLARMNDDGETFGEIATFIEDNL